MSMTTRESVREIFINNYAPRGNVLSWCIIFHYFFKLLTIFTTSAETRDINPRIRMNKYFLKKIIKVGNPAPPIIFMPDASIKIKTKNKHTSVNPKAISIAIMSFLFFTRGLLFHFYFKEGKH